MSTVRRLYFYALTLISVEVIIWGVVNLLRTMVTRGVTGGGSSLATGLSLVLVGIPIFWLHWRAAQKDARREEEEHTSRVRAVFLYAALAATLFPMVYAVLAVLHRELTTLLGGLAYMAWFGGGGSTIDNLIAILVNAAAFVYFWFVLRGDWRENPAETHLAETRRLYRYIWVLFSLTLTVVGAYNLLEFILSLPGSSPVDNAVKMSGAISLLVIGVPLWIYHWNSVQSVLVDVDERRSLLRLVVLYLISLAGVIGVIAAVGRVLNSLIRWLTDDLYVTRGLLRTNSGGLAAAVVLGLMWWYYGRILRKEVSTQADQSRREGLARLYDYILTLMGLSVSFTGLISLVEFAGHLLFGGRSSGIFENALSGGLSALLVGLPVWLIPWRDLQRKAARSGSAGDHARRSILRKIYLYLVLFLLMIGMMVFAGQLLYILLNSLLDRPEPDLRFEVFRMVLTLGIMAGLLVYHFQILRRDARFAQQALGNLHASFPTLVFVEESGAPRSADEQAFSDALVQTLARIAPRLPVAVHLMERGAPDDTMLDAKAIILPAALVLEPPESLRLWLKEFHGLRILIPFAREDWFWLGQSKKKSEELAREAAESLRQIAEGEMVRQSLPDNPWVLASYVLGGLFGLILLFLIFTLLLSSILG